MRKNCYVVAVLLLLGAAFEATATEASGMDAKVAMCIGCHGITGYKASFPEVYKVPKLAGQQAGYLAAALRAYRDGTRKHPTMRGIARSLTDQDIDLLAKYYEGQK